MVRLSSTTETRRTTGRLRLVVIQALVFSLFATLFVRLYYLQVVGGADYQAQAARALRGLLGRHQARDRSGSR